MKKKSRIDLIHHLGKPSFLNVQLHWGAVHIWYDAEGKEIDPPEVVYVRADEGKSELSRALNYRLNTYSINGEEYICIHYAQVSDGNDDTRSEYGYWPVGKVYSIDPNILMNAKDIDDLYIQLDNPTFVLARDTDEDGYHWEDSNGNVIDPLDAGLMRIDTSSELSRACGEGFAICGINGKEYVMLSMGWDEFGSGAYGFWPIEEVYAIDPNILDDEIVYRRSY